MKKYLLLPIAACLMICGCSSTANLTTTQNQPEATVDDSSKIAPGATVTSANTTSTTIVSSMEGPVLTLTPAPTQTGTVPATFKNTVAGQFQHDLKSYGQTLGNLGQTLLPKIAAAAGNVASLTQLIKSNASDWGLSPTNPEQQKALDNFIKNSGKVATDATALLNFLTGLQTTGATS